MLCVAGVPLFSGAVSGKLVGAPAFHGKPGPLATPTSGEAYNLQAQLAVKPKVCNPQLALWTPFGPFQGSSGRFRAPMWSQIVQI